MQRGGCVYIISNKNRSVFYIGVTANLYTRTSEHKQGIGSAFTKKYNCTDLVYYETFGSIEEAIKREKQLKEWKRAWKERLIKESNPEMRDLYDDLK
ncbi:GIY-YIG nuclease family protein [Cesiribacter andamanensis]|uniref:GIY-YIG nuclease superfamily protein n=1 Tax=Cesiribacter andamanensis AMV16 TaxID=1279009 RepID=M7NUD8_9BACT|nr:GIY-YIG nuclease family protein [Cesiribacter andamanensis]EMR02104.1 GIY-YIG nuclease superfamily protein [Cesiribacter andamanensis AMV16]